jgi:hypothetical protein
MQISLEDQIDKLICQMHRKHQGARWLDVCLVLNAEHMVRLYPLQGLEIYYLHLLGLFHSICTSLTQNRLNYTTAKMCKMDY